MAWARLFTVLPHVYSGLGASLVITLLIPAVASNQAIARPAGKRPTRFLSLGDKPPAGQESWRCHWLPARGWWRRRLSSEPLILKSTMDPEICRWLDHRSLEEGPLAVALASCCAHECAWRRRRRNAEHTSSHQPATIRSGSSGSGMQADPPLVFPCPMMMAVAVGPDAPRCSHPMWEGLSACISALSMPPLPSRAQPTASCGLKLTLLT